MAPGVERSTRGPRRIGATLDLGREGVRTLPRGRRNPWRWLQFIWAARHLDVIVTTGVAGAAELYDDIVLAAICVRLYPRLRAVISECLWEPGSRALNRRFGISTPPAVDAPERFALQWLIGRLLPRLDHPRMHYLVLGDDERPVFARSWRIPIERVHFTPYWATAEQWAQEPIEALSVDVFAGGDSLRDYRTLLAAAERVDGSVVIGTRLGRPSRVPDNVRYGPLDPDTYARYAAGARVIVVCLREDAPRSSGQQTYLNAMLAGIPVIVLRSLGVTDHVEDGVTGVVVAHDVEQLAAAINEALEGSPAVRERARAGQRAARSTFTAERYFASILDIADRV